MAARPVSRVAKSSVRVLPSPLEFPKCHYQNVISPLPCTREATAIEDLKTAYAHLSEPSIKGKLKETLIIDLNSFAVSRHPEKHRPNELVSLDNLSYSRRGVKLLFFDGTLSLAGCQRYVQNRPFRTLSLEGYDDGSGKAPPLAIYLQSITAQEEEHFDIWYRLGSPSPEYQLFHRSFAWVAQFTIFFVEYLETDTDIDLRSFQNDFHEFLMAKYGHISTFQRWMTQYGQKTDFRTVINANIDFLYNETFNTNKALSDHQVWRDCNFMRPAIDKHPVLCERTVNTPFVYDCFRKMYFGDQLQLQALAEPVEKAQQCRMRSLGFPIDSRRQSTATTQRPKYSMSTAEASTNTVTNVKVGDIVGVHRDELSKWKGSKSVWLAYVQRIDRARIGALRIYVLWLYRPADTTILTAEYPIKNEVFISDNCNCTDSPLTPSDLVGKFSIEWNPKDLNTRKDFLVRKKYVTEECSFVTCQKSDLTCECQNIAVDDAFEFEAGDSVYIMQKSNLDPVIITSVRQRTQEVRVRRLLRLSSERSTAQRDTGCHTVPPNELAWTDEIYSAPFRRIMHKCHIRFFSTEESIPVPYNRGGTGDFWFIRSRLKTDDTPSILQALHRPFPGPLNEGFNPKGKLPVEPLKGLSMFSGGGNLDRGLEEGGAVEFLHAVEISGAAVHTQRANAKDPKALGIYWLSVDDFVEAQAIGSHERIPIIRIGDIQFVAAGSPCPGLSSLQKDWQSSNSKKNTSLITSFCSTVDIFRPSYAVLENVVTMARDRRPTENDSSENVFAQVIACLVAMGYQVKQILGDSWSHGSFQRRERLFISITAPGLVPMEAPHLTHSHPPDMKLTSIGQLPNGERFGRREDWYTPFPYNTPQSGLSDLPHIGASINRPCIPFPDHRMTRELNYKDRSLIKMIPVRPFEQNYAKALAKGLIPTSLQKLKKMPGKSWGRLHPRKLVPTITTKASPEDSRCGNILHWEEHRPLTIQDARRTQGILDNEVIIGTPAGQWKIIGNAVDRRMALALGFSLRWALLKNHEMGHKEASKNEIWDDPSVSRAVETVTDLASKLARGHVGEARLLPDTKISGTISVQRERTVENMARTQTTIDRLSILSETTISTTVPTKPPKAVPLKTRPATSKRSDSVNIARLRQENTKKRTHKDVVEVSDDNGVSPPRKKTRHSGLIAQHVPSDWSKRVEAVIYRGK